MNARITYDVAWNQIQGQRYSQQDRAACIHLSGHRHLLVLADGVGGRFGGDVASATAVASFCEAFRAVVTPSDATERLRAALKAANFAIGDQSLAIPELVGMGSTLTAATINEANLHWISLGDSPLWLFRKKTMRLLNANDTQKKDLALDGKTIAAFTRSSRKSLPFDALFGYPEISFESSTKSVKLKLGDVVMLASDGIETCSNGELLKIVYSYKGTAANIAKRVLAAVEAHRNEYQDNATVIVCKFLD